MAHLTRVTRSTMTGILNQEFIRVETEAFSTCPALSIDYAVMEHA